MSEWFYSLYKNKDLKILNFDYNFSDNLMICRQEDNTRKFSMFKNFTYFQKFQQSVLKDERCFYEVILGKKSRKPYFDIDISLETYPDMTVQNADELIDILIENIKDVLNDYRPKIIVFTSHRKTKLSYHVIVDGVFIRNNEDSKEFSKKVLPIEMKEFVDGRVYNTVQQLRIAGSTKEGKNNFKVVDFSLSDNFYIPSEADNQFKKTNFILKSSLVTYTEECAEYKMPSTKRKSNQIAKGSASEFDIGDALDILKRHYSNFSFRQAREKNGNILVELSSVQPYMCKIHNRIHENENAYIIIKGRLRDIWFDCRRIEQHEKTLAPKIIGTLGLPKKKYIDMSFNINNEEN